mgnify:FL=1
MKRSLLVGVTAVASSFLALLVSCGCSCTDCESNAATDQHAVADKAPESTGAELAGTPASNAKPSKVFVAGQPVSGNRVEPAAPSKAGSSAPIDVLQSYMTGSFSSEAQHLADPDDYFDIRLHMAPIWQDRSSTTERWLYVEQASAKTLDKPYRQRVYRLASVGAHQVRSEVYEFADGKPLVHAGKWQAPQAFDSLELKDIFAREGCALLLTFDGKVFNGSTDGQSCLTDFRGAKYTTSEANISPAGLLTWDRGWNEKNEQVWGATKSGYNFVRIAE